MCDQQTHAACRVHLLAQQREYLRSTACIEIARRLVREYELRPVDVSKGEARP